MSGSRRPDLGSIAIPRAVKGEAVPVQDLGQGRGGEPRQEGAEPGRGRMPFSPDVEPPPASDPRASASFRLTLALQERLRVAAYRSRRSKQEIVEEALDRFLTGLGQ